MAEKLGSSSASSPHLVSSLAQVRVIESTYTGGIIDASCSGDLLITSVGATLVVTNACSGEEYSRIEGDGSTCTNFLLRPGKMEELYVATTSLLLYVYDLSDRTHPQMIRKWKPHTLPVLAMSFDPSGTFLGTASADKTAKVWDVEHGYLTHLLRGHTSLVSHICFARPLIGPSSDSNDEQFFWAITAGEEQVIRVWNLLEKGVCVQVFDNVHMGGITRIRFDPTRSCVITGARDQALNLFSVDKSGLHLAGTIPVLQNVEDALFLELDGMEVGLEDASSQFGRCIVATDQGHLRIFDLEKKTNECSLLVPHPFQSGQSSSFESYHSDSDVYVAHMRYIKLDNDMLTSLGVSSFIPGNPALIYACSDQTLCMILFNGTNEPLCLKTSVGFNGTITAVKFFPSNCVDSNTRSGSDPDVCNFLPPIAVATNSPTVQLLDIATGACSLVRGHRDVVLAIDISSCGKFLLSGSKDKQVLLHHIDLGDNGIRDARIRVVGRCIGHTSSLTSIRLSHHRQFAISTAEDQTVKCWSILPFLKSKHVKKLISSQTIEEITCTHTNQAHSKESNCCDISPNDALVVTGGQDKLVKVWNVVSEAAGNVHLHLQCVCSGHRRGIWSVRFSPTERVVMSSSGDKTIRVWSIEDGSCLKTLQGHSHGVLSAQFLSRGLQVLSSSADGLLKLWSVKYSECMVTAEASEEKIWAMDTFSFSQEGLKSSVVICTGAADGEICLWKDDTVEREELAVAEKEEFLLQEQELSNAIRKKDFPKVVRLALELKQPAKLLLGLTGIVEQELVEKELSPLVSNISREDLFSLLVFCRDWNTNARSSLVANVVLHCILKNHSLQELTEIPRVGDIVSAILSYNERHLGRMERFLQRTFLVDYTLNSMQVLTPVLKSDSIHNVAEMRRQAAITKEKVETNQPAWKKVIRERSLTPASKPTISTSVASDQDGGTGSDSRDVDIAADFSIPSTLSRARQAHVNDVKHTEAVWHVEEPVPARGSRQEFSPSHKRRKTNGDTGFRSVNAGFPKNRFHR